MTPLCLNSLIKDSYELVEHKLKELNINFDLPLFEDSYMVQGREVQLGQVFTNLLKNSIDAIYHQKNPWIKLEITQDENFCYIKFIDSGLGIPKDIKEKIMQPFFTTKGVGKGTGLGLAICSKIIKDHGGTLTILDANPNTCFEVKIPK